MKCPRRAIVAEIGTMHQGRMRLELALSLLVTDTRFGRDTLRELALEVYWPGDEKGSDEEESLALMALYDLVDFKVAFNFGRAANAREFWTCMKDEHLQSDAEEAFAV